ncbi:MAG: AAA family ATPase [Methanoregula sp.]|nr:AAA family ATPase [Methanoregula sp.]
MFRPDRKNILINGAPGSGKTTLVRTIAHNLHDLCPVGFYTAEIRINGIRQGFELVSLSGERRILSHVTINSPHRVGKYKVDINGFEEFCTALPLGDTRHPLIIIDEIGKMECMSAQFRQMVEQALISDTIVLATIALKGDRFIEGIRQRDDVELFTVSQQNRHILPDLIIPKIRKMVGETERDTGSVTLKKKRPDLACVQPSTTLSPIYIRSQPPS